MSSGNPMNFDWQVAYPHPRTPIFASNIVATSQPLAAQAGLQVLQRGGNAVDATIAAAAAITVVEPVSNGLGSDSKRTVTNSKGSVSKRHRVRIFACG